MDTRTVELALGLFLDTKRAENAAPATVEYYQYKVGNLLQWMREQQLASVTAECVRQFLLHRAQHENPQTLHGTYRAVRHFLRWCHAQELLRENVMQHVKAPKQQQLLKPALSDDELKRCLQACERKGWLFQRDKALLLLLVDTGLRIAEAHALRVRDIMSETVIVHGKGNKQRSVFLSAQTRLALIKYLQACPHQPSQDEPLWWGERGALTCDGLKQAVRSIGERAGVHLHPHRLRRTCATMCLRAGMGLEYVRRLLGHSDYRMTMQYLALMDEDVKQAHKTFSPVAQIFSRGKTR